MLGRTIVGCHLPERYTRTICALITRLRAIKITHHMRARQSIKQGEDDTNMDRVYSWKQDQGHSYAL